MITHLEAVNDSPNMLDLKMITFLYERIPSLKLPQTNISFLKVLHSSNGLFCYFDAGKKLVKALTTIKTKASGSSILADFANFSGCVLIDSSMSQKILPDFCYFSQNANS